MRGSREFEHLGELAFERGAPAEHVQAERQAGQEPHDRLDGATLEDRPGHRVEVLDLEGEAERDRGHVAAHRQ
jgi:hypothetical protein